MVKKGFDFPKEKSDYNIHIVIYIPSTVDVNKKIPPRQFKARINETVKFLRQNLGGSTTVIGSGNYKSQKYGSVTENVAKVECFTTVDDYDKADLKIKKWLQNKRREWRQESIQYEFEESTYLITPKG